MIAFMRAVTEVCVFLAFVAAFFGSVYLLAALLNAVVRRVAKRKFREQHGIEFDEWYNRNIKKPVYPEKSK